LLFVIGDAVERRLFVANRRAITKLHLKLLWPRAGGPVPRRARLAAVEGWIGFSAARIESFVDSSRAPEKMIFI
jgi:hypothetical protein